MIRVDPQPRANRPADVELAPTACAICGPNVPSRELYRSTVSAADFNPEVFSQRRVPDRVHYRTVRCLRCGLVRADPSGMGNALQRLYEQSRGFDAEETNLRRTYGRYLRRLQRFGARRGDLLEIGAGTGFFLVEAQAQGYVAVKGVEPSRDAVAGAEPSVAQHVVRDMMRPGLFEAASFDVVCLFQVFDHLEDPNVVLAECRRVLRPGGLVLALNHDVDATTNRLMGERSPIIDVEHIYLYSRSTMDAIFARNGFDVLEVGRAWNDYSLRYLVRLAPFPPSLKRLLTNGFVSTLLGRVNVRIPLGNLYLLARNPTNPEES